MASPPTTATRHRVRSSDSSRGWLAQGLTALAISALGLAIAGSVAVTTSAQPPATNDAASLPVTPKAAPDAPSPTKITDPSLTAFARPKEQATGQKSRSAAVRIAVVQERSAQRAEELAKTDDEITRAARAENNRVRQQTLSAAEQAQQTAAAALAKANLQRAAAAAAAATIARQEAETAATSTTTATPSTTTPSAAPAAVAVTGGSSSPVPGAVVGAHFGQYGLWSRYHTGLDFRASYGTPIKAVKSGVVLYAGNSGDWAGNHVAIRHPDGKTTMSSHMSSMAVRAGQSVQAGQVIGYVGQTGRAFGAHLHFEVYPAGVKYGDVYRAINPAPWLSANGVQTH